MRDEVKHVIHVVSLAVASGMLVLILAFFGFFFVIGFLETTFSR